MTIAGPGGIDLIAPVGQAASHVADWYSHGSLFIYMKDTDQWAELDYEQKKITNVWNRTDSPPPKPSTPFLGDGNFTVTTPGFNDTAQFIQGMFITKD